MSRTASLALRLATYWSRYHLAVAALFLFCSAGAAVAGRPCEEKPLTPTTIQRALDLALETRDKLDAAGAEVALIGRAGQDLSTYGLRYSHAGFVWRDHPKGRWRIVHELNECGTAQSDIFDEGLANFFMDDLWRMEAVILIPQPETQSRLAATFAARRHLQLHSPRYNMVSYPFSTRYQNSNQWLLEVLAMAGATGVQINSREQAQQWLRLAAYEPTELKIDALTRFGARVARANIAFDDHPGELRWSDRIRTASVESVLRFVEAREPQARRFEVLPK